MTGPAHPGHKNENIIIGLSGYARSGKDSIANVLVEEYGFKRFAFADKLRECLYALNPVVRANEEYNHPFEGPMMYTYLRNVIDEDGWDGYKEGYYGDEIRRLLQRMGTEVGRELIGDTIWVDELDKHSGRIVVTDLRFPNEYDKVKSLGGKVWRVNRIDVTAVNAHVSEIALDSHVFDGYLRNDGTLDDLRNNVLRYAETLSL